MPASADAQQTVTVRVHHLRKDGLNQGWGLHVWGDVRHETEWTTFLPPSGRDDAGSYWDVEVHAQAKRLGFLVHKGEEKAAGGELLLNGRPVAPAVWLMADRPEVLLQRPPLSEVPAGSISKQSAHWVAAGTVAWRHAASDAEGARKFQLHYSRSGSLSITGAGVQGSDMVFDLKAATTVLPAGVATRSPFLQGCTALQLPSEAAAQISLLVQGQLLVSMASASGSSMDATGIQVQGVLDDLFYTDAPLGDTDGRISVWAPTAQKVELLHWRTARGGEPEVHAMAPDAQGVWSLAKPEGWLWTYYLYRVTVYCPCSQKVEQLLVADPYSRGLAANGERTQVVDLESPEVTPAGWHTHDVPTVAQFTDISVYELHIRDFSIHDESVPAALKGKYLAFCPDHVSPGGAPLTAGLQHLAGLREAGMNHLHLLPFYDFCSVPERPEEQKEVKDEDLAQHAPDSERQQALIAEVYHEDAFNWGYDPFCWGVPEGSYATEPDGPARILEARTMIQALHGQGWRVVPDVVYNHVLSANNDRYSLLDKVVPGYYMRREEDGSICQSTCCNNTASEHLMCERLVIDDCQHWAQNYKVDGFRFDIMAHMMLSTMNKIRARIDSMTKAEHGTVGKDIYIYGEAWEFGEMTLGRRGVNAGQMNLAGSKLGAFNERMRDGALGGGPFHPPDFQGFATGLALQPNRCRGQGGPEQQMQELLVLSDWLRWSLAGNLRQYTSVAADGRTVRGDGLLAHGFPLAYGSEVCENVSFVGCHDNQTMFDLITEKVAPEVSLEDRQRVAALCISLIVLSQGVPFIHAGDDLLRSKSLDRDSYNSGDWFNKIDWTGQDNNFGVGLPTAFKNEPSWAFKRPLLADLARNKPGHELLQRTAEHTRVMLRVRYSSPLFRLAQAADVQQQVSFHNTGPRQVPGVVVMELQSAASEQSGGVFDPLYERLLVVFNASPSAQRLALPAGVAADLHLHPLLAGHPDTRVAAARVEAGGGAVVVEGRTTAVFVTPRAIKTAAQ